MADQKISALPASTTPLAGSEVLPVVQSGTTKQVSVANLTAGRAVSTGALSVVGADATLDNAYALKGKLVAGSAVGMLLRNSSDQVAIDPDGYGTVIGFSGTRLEVTSGNATLQNGNLVQGTAAKGVNFTANTPAAGMTSQLLNWYEEGTWTPTQGASLTVVGSFSSSGTYTRIGRQVTVRGVLTGSTSVSVNAGGVMSGGVPFSSPTGFSGTMFNDALNASGVSVISVSDVYAIDTMAATPSICFVVTYFV